MKTWITFLWSLLLSGVLCAQQFEVSTSREEIMIGEQIELELTLKCQAADSFTLPDLSDTLHPMIEVLEKRDEQVKYEGADLNQKIVSQAYLITSFDSGYHAVAPLRAVVNDDTVRSSPFLVSVQTVPIDTAKGIYDIRGVAEVPFSLVEWMKENWVPLVLALLLLAGGVLLFLWWKNRKPVVVEAPPAPKRPPHEVALERLDALEQEKLWQQDQVKRYYSELTDIVREYIEERFELPALEQTTDEIMAEVRRVPSIPAESVEKLHRLLFTADLVKFAKERPVGSENEQHLTHSRAFVTATIPPVKEAEPTEMEKPTNDG